MGTPTGSIAGAGPAPRFRRSPISVRAIRGHIERNQRRRGDRSSLTRQRAADGRGKAHDGDLHRATRPNVGALVESITRCATDLAEAPDLGPVWRAEVVSIGGSKYEGASLMHELNRPILPCGSIDSRPY
jgi:hypothetical protein